jgi:hypothetical protein
MRLARERLKSWPRAGSAFAALERWLFGDKVADKLDEHLQIGDSRAAVVVSRTPLLVAAYTDELDCVALLGFPAQFLDRFGLNVGTRLLTVNTYWAMPQVAADLSAGPAELGRFQNFYPLIAEFLSDDSARIARRKAEIGEPEWERCLALGREYLTRRPGLARDGSPFHSARPAKLARS